MPSRAASTSCPRPSTSICVILRMPSSSSMTSTRWRAEAGRCDARCRRTPPPFPRRVFGPADKRFADGFDAGFDLRDDRRRPDRTSLCARSSRARAHARATESAPTMATLPCSECAARYSASRSPSAAALRTASIWPELSPISESMSCATSPRDPRASRPRRCRVTSPAGSDAVFSIAHWR